LYLVLNSVKHLLVNNHMTNYELIEQGNQLRNSLEPAAALKCYAQAFVDDPTCQSAWNNYGNVLREMGYPDRAVPFLEHARVLEPDNVTAEFNLSVAYLLAGCYEQGWPLYESRWRYEHLAGTKPVLPRPEWTGESLSGKTILVVGEQGLGDQIQFLRFVVQLIKLGAQVRLHVSDPLRDLVSETADILSVSTGNTVVGEFDYWISIMSLPLRLGITEKNLPQDLHYLTAAPDTIKFWADYLGSKKQMRVGIAWSGRPDSWLNQHKGMSVDQMLKLVQRYPEHQWISLQYDATPEDREKLAAAGVIDPVEHITSLGTTAGLLANLDLVITVDTAVAHLSGALGRPTWIPLNAYANCWRWGVRKDSCLWYPSARLFRQPAYGDWNSVIDRLEKFISWFKI
jgi:tetratricopeptide (TPR) repeat protein